MFSSLDVRICSRLLFRTLPEFLAGQKQHIQHPKNCRSRNYFESLNTNNDVMIPQFANEGETTAIKKGNFDIESPFLIKIHPLQSKL